VNYTPHGLGQGATSNRLSADALAEVGIDTSRETTKPVDPALVHDDYIVVTLGREASVDQVAVTRSENWDTDEPSERGIDGIERMRRVAPPAPALSD
jgi:arsenate-mycothiol transferase